MIHLGSKFHVVINSQAKQIEGRDNFYNSGVQENISANRRFAKIHYLCFRRIDNQLVLFAVMRETGNVFIDGGRN